ncbi:hypothetical protein [Nocardioides ungokensis]|uniref:hypothetical protein n=1 Tax=Nocardioides ungokensis TaxID=1643322 RepID=UPI0015DDD4AE|nr:hypothetical protein [Nocardioides ungokensis]
MTGKLLIIPTLAVGLAAAVTTAVGPAGAAGDAPTTVTIHADGTDLSGTVSSPKPRKCANNRLVVVFKQKGTRGGGDDVRFASDTASRSGNVFAWSTGNTGTEGRFYAKVRHIDGCKGDTSPTIRAVRNP